MNEISNLEPQSLWSNFCKINEIPRPSKKEEKIIAFMMKFGQDLGLETTNDQVGNVIIKKPASPGMENRKTIILQSHLDMVCQKNNDTEFDFDTQGIQMYLTEDGFVKAKGTTLGADNGIGVAAIMSILESKDIPHPPIEALFTIDEETGMTGAIGLDPKILQGEILLNLDTEEDNELTIGCAGGMDVTATKKFEYINVDNHFKSIQVLIKGLKGGHSGGDIHLGLGNANKLLGRFLYEATCFESHIATMDSGSLRNAIPREGNFVITVKNEDYENLISAFNTLKSDILVEFKNIEPNIDIEIANVETIHSVASREETKKLAQALMIAFNGVYRMSPEIEGLTETSNNVARVSVENGEMKILCLSRSALESNKKLITETLKSSFELAGFQVEFSGGYPGWRPNMNSEILELMKTIYEKRFGESAKVAATHGGLECGIIGGHYPNLDMISFGPNIYSPHSPDERVEIKSVQKFWGYFLEILANSPLK